MSGISIDIDRIILTDLELSPDRAESIRDLLQIELQRLLENENIPDNITSGEISGMDTQDLDLNETQSDLYLANSLALSIVRTLQSVG